MTKILVTGASGFVGLPLCHHLLSEGFDIRAAIRNAEAGKKLAGIDIAIVGDIDAYTNWKDALIDVDVVIHLAARVHVLAEDATDPLSAFRDTNLFASENLMRQSIDAGVKRFIHLSSIHVNGLITHKHPFTPTDTPSPLTPYALSKWEAEQTLEQLVEKTSMDLIIIRSPLVYGPGVKGNMKRLLDAVWKGTPLPLQGVQNNRTMIGLGNLIDLITTCLRTQHLYREVILATDGRDISTPTLIQKIGEAMGKKPRLFPVPRKILYYVARLLGKEQAFHALFSSQQISHYRTKWLLNWHPPIPMSKEIQRMVDSYKESMEAHL